MSWGTAELLHWLDEVEPRADQRSHFEWLEMTPTVSSTAIQNAYHAVARTRHPDLARKQLGPRDLDRLVRMFARVAAAYAALRNPEAATNYLRSLRDSQRMTAVMMPSNMTPPTGLPARPSTVPPFAAATPALAPAAAPAPAPAPAPAGPVDPSRAMNARALAFYRRAEGALRTGDRTTALLQIRMAIAADPRSPLLRAALAELMTSD